MADFNFSTIAPKTYLATPKTFRSDNDLSMILDNLSDTLVMSSLDRGEMELSEYAAKIMDEHLHSENGKNDLYLLKDISYRIGKHFSGAFEVITNVINPEVEMLTSRIDETSKQLMDRKLGYTDKNGNYTNKAPRFKLLDVNQLYSAYHSSAQSCAVNLCKKYNYFIDSLNDNNITGLLERIDPVNDIQVSKETLSAILEDIAVTVVTDSDGEVTIDTNAPETIQVEGDGVTVTNTEDDNTATDTSDVTTDSSVNINVVTGDDDANVDITVDGDNLSTEKELLAVLEECDKYLSEFERMQSVGLEGLDTDAVASVLKKLQLIVRKNFLGSEKVLQVILVQLERLSNVTKTSNFKEAINSSKAKYIAKGDDGGYSNFILNLNGLKHLESLIPKYQEFENNHTNFLMKVLDMYAQLDTGNYKEFATTVGSGENIEAMLKEMHELYKKFNSYPPEMFGCSVNPDRGGITPFDEDKLAGLMKPYVVGPDQTLEIDEQYINTAIPFISKIIQSHLQSRKKATQQFEKFTPIINRIGEISKKAAKDFVDRTGKAQDVGKYLATMMYMYKATIRLLATTNRLLIRLWIVLVKREVKELAKAVNHYTGKSLAKEGYIPEDHQLLKSMVAACFSATGFKQLRKELFADKGNIRGTHLLNSLYFVSHSINKLMEKCGPKYLNPSTMTMVRHNLSNLHELQMGTLIFLDISSSRFSDKMLISKTLLNKNQVIRAQNDGVDIYPLLRDYLRVYHNDDQDDLYHNQMQNQAINKGISYDQILVTRYDVEQKLIKAKETTKETYQQLLTSSRQEAFKTVMSKYIKEVAERGTVEELKVKENDKASFISRNTLKINNLHSQMVQNKDVSNVEDLIYSFYLSNWYGGTLVEDVYYHVGEYLRQHANRTTLSSEAINMVKSEAIATLATKYLFDHMINP